MLRRSLRGTAEPSRSTVRRATFAQGLEPALEQALALDHALDHARAWLLAADTPVVVSAAPWAAAAGSA